MANATFDLLLTGGMIVDGANSPSFEGDVGILGDRIAAVGDLRNAVAKLVINVAGKVVCPGFIDVHTHDDIVVLVKPDCFPKVSQGVTTVIVGNCGISAAPLQLAKDPPEPLNLLGEKSDFVFESFRQYAEMVEAARPAVNTAALVGHTSLRVKHVGELSRTATTRETASMQKELEKAMAEGSIGLSTGLAYKNAFAATTDEVSQLARVAAKYGGIYATHMRDEFDGILEALEESITIGSEAKLPIVISHLKCAGPKNWGRSGEVLAAIESSHYHDHLYMDCYPYNAGSSNLDLNQVDEQVDILITRSDPHPEQVQKLLAQIAQEWGVSQREAAQRLMPAGAVYFSIDEQDMRAILGHEKVMIGSDGLPCDPHPHPRLFGTFPRVLGKYSREEALFPLRGAIHKMTGLPASIFNLRDRGELKSGYFADIVVFDPIEIRDVATFESPNQKSIGIEYVLVNGVITFRHGHTTGERAGRYIRNSSSTN
ncbi:N-acyl-D-amino-acid deacylase family protein [Bremerella sp. P1]|uniref:N-acyl-D-amino-acid deacylase family protein n=1 Tax=Bremerella sp. P1 TaxID=3026424 RepID=UPI002368CA5B|nr:D-aminoacylase [Bremerella sp. P1]WDI43748.1 D-aminoacylase [Bremerella sp. P1]